MNVNLSDEQINEGLSLEHFVIIYKNIKPTKNITFFVCIFMCIYTCECSINYTLWNLHFVFLLFHEENAKCKILFVMNQNQAIKKQHCTAHRGFSTAHSPCGRCGLLTNGCKNPFNIKRYSTLKYLNQNIFQIIQHTHTHNKLTSTKSTLPHKDLMLIFTSQQAKHESNKHR